MLNASAIFKSPTISTVRRAAAKLGASVEDDGIERLGGEPQRVYQCVAPPGKVWACDFITMLLVRWTVGDAADRADACADVLDRMSYGLCEQQPDVE